MKHKWLVLLAGFFFASLWGADAKVLAYEKSIHFSGYEWEVRHNDYLVGPGPNYFSNSDSNVWVDEAGNLHLKLTYRNGRWYGAEIINKQALGYGKYTFYLDAQLDKLDPNVVFGLFTYDTESADATASSFREIDIEFAEWGKAIYPNAQYTIWHRENTDNAALKNDSHTFDLSMPYGTWSTHSFNWQPKQIDFESLGGHYATSPSADYAWQTWSYAGPYVPNEGKAKIHMNLWLHEGLAPSDKQEVEVIVSKFTFEPYSEPKTAKTKVKNRTNKHPFAYEKNKITKRKH